MSQGKPDPWCCPGDDESSSTRYPVWSTRHVPVTIPAALYAWHYQARRDPIQAAVSTNPGPATYSAHRNWCGSESRSLVGPAPSQKSRKMAPRRRPGQLPATPVTLSGRQQASAPTTPASCLMRRGAQRQARWWWRAAPRVTPDQLSSLSQPLSPKPICV